MMDSEQADPCYWETHDKWIGQVVWAKTASYPWWPCYVYDPAVCPAISVRRQHATKKGKTYIVVYYGDYGQYNFVTEKNLQLYNQESKEKYTKSKIAAKFEVSFKQAVQTADEELLRDPAERVAWDHPGGMKRTAAAAGTAPQPATRDSFSKTINKKPVQKEGESAQTYSPKSSSSSSKDNSMGRGTKRARSDDVKALNSIENDNDGDYDLVDDDDGAADSDDDNQASAMDHFEPPSLVPGAEKGEKKSQIEGNNRKMEKKTSTLRKVKEKEEKGRGKGKREATKQAEELQIGTESVAPKTKRRRVTVIDTAEGGEEEEQDGQEERDASHGKQQLQQKKRGGILKNDSKLSSESGSARNVAEGKGRESIVGRESMDTETREQRIERLVKTINRFSKPLNMDISRALKAIHKLSIMSLTLEEIQQYGAALAMNELRKHSNSNLCAAARELREVWKAELQSNLASRSGSSLGTSTEKATAVAKSAAYSAGVGEKLSGQSAGGRTGGAASKGGREGEGEEELYEDEEFSLEQIPEKVRENRFRTVAIRVLFEATFSMYAAIALESAIYDAFCQRTLVYKEKRKNEEEDIPGKWEKNQSKYFESVNYFTLSMREKTKNNGNDKKNTGNGDDGTDARDDTGNSATLREVKKILLTQKVATNVLPQDVQSLVSSVLNSDRLRVF